jgi:hypothetical protein
MHSVVEYMLSSNSNLNALSTLVSTQPLEFLAEEGSLVLKVEESWHVLDEFNNCLEITLQNLLIVRSVTLAVNLLHDLIENDLVLDTERV